MLNMPVERITLLKIRIIFFRYVTDKPEIDMSPLLVKAAARKGDTGRLICRASGAPKVVFAWSHNGNQISLNTTSKYHSNFLQVRVLHNVPTPHC